MLKAIGGEVKSQELNDNFSYLDSSKMDQPNNLQDGDLLMWDAQNYKLKKATTTLKVATWNIHSGKDMNDTYIDLSAFPKDYMIEGGYDVVGLQELRVNYSGSHPNSKDPLTAIASTYFDFKRFYRAQYLVEEPTAEYGIGILSKHGMVRHTQFTLPNTSSDPAVVEQRILSQAEMYVKGRRIYLFNTHIRWDNDSIRLQQLTYIKDKLAALNGASFILFGDFNVKANSEYDIFSDYQMVNGYNGQWIDTYNPTNDGLRSLDNIICSNDFTIKNIGLRTSTASDHSILYADLIY